MRRAAVVVLIAAVPCLTCGTVNQQTTGQAAETNSNNLSALEDLGVCGPIHEALIRFGPKDSDGALDTAAIEREPTSFGSWGLEMNPPPGLNVVVAGRRPSLLGLHEYVGVLQGMYFVWDGGRRERSAVWRHALKEMKRARGTPERSEKGRRDWYQDETQILLARSKDLQAVAVFVSCVPYMEQLKASAEKQEASPDNTTANTASAQPEAPPHDPRLEHSVADILRDFGLPTHAYVLTDQIVCFHYTGTEGPINAPAETWWWFFEGRAVYHATEFLPPSGSDRALGSFQYAKDWMRKAFGAPFEELRGGSSPTFHRFEYADGILHGAITLFDAGGDPYFCTEFFDSTVIDKLGPDLRPDRSLPKRYTPPPRDSGLTREDFESEAVAG